MAQRLGGDGRRVPATAPGHPRSTPARRTSAGDLWDSREWRDGLDAAPAPRPPARRHRRRVHKRNRLAIVVTLLAVAVAGGVVLGRMAWDRVGGTLDASADSAGNNLSEPSKPSVVTATAGAAELGPVRGAGTFTYASGKSVVLSANLPVGVPLSPPTQEPPASA